MINEDYVSFETAKLLKEKGFNEYCYGYYYTPKYITHGDFKQKNLELFPDSCSAPTLQMAMKWLREEHNIQIVISPYNIPNKTWSYYLSKNFEVLTQHFYSFITYEEACEAAIKYCLENLI